MRGRNTSLYLLPFFCQLYLFLSRLLYCYIYLTLFMAFDPNLLYCLASQWCQKQYIRQWNKALTYLAAHSSSGMVKMDHCCVLYIYVGTSLQAQNGCINYSRQREHRKGCESAAIPDGRLAGYLEILQFWSCKNQKAIIFIWHFFVANDIEAAFQGFQSPL